MIQKIKQSKIIFHSELLSNAIRDTTYPIDFSIYSTCPRAAEMDPQEFSPVNIKIYRSILNILINTNINFIQYNMNYPSSLSPSRSPINAVPSGKRLLVKVVKGEGITLARDPYCVVEMDEPPQKNQTGVRQGSSPYWDEHFLL